jgi:hypothetical protein
VSKSVAVPKAGNPPAYAFYETLLDDYNDLVNGGNRDPAKVLARRYKVPRATMRVWLSRGRRYLERETLAVPYVQHCPTCTC